MSTARALLITPEEYLERERQAETKSEYFNGAIFAMAGASFSHNVLVGNFTTALNQALIQSPCMVAPTDTKVRVDSTGLYTYPDIVVVCEQPKFADSKRDVLLNPIVIVEVLSQSTEAYDRGEKFAHYRTIESLRAYVLVSQWSHHVEVFSREAGSDSWVYSDATGIDSQISIPALNLTLQLADIYRKVELTAKPLYVIKDDRVTTS